MLSSLSHQVSALFRASDRLLTLDYAAVLACTSTSVAHTFGEVKGQYLYASYKANLLTALCIIDIVILTADPDSDFIILSLDPKSYLLNHFPVTV